jgi:GTP-binding protein
MNPPVVIIHGNSLEHVTEAYKRFPRSAGAKGVQAGGHPLRIEMKTARNPYAQKD